MKKYFNLLHLLETIVYVASLFIIVPNDTDGYLLLGYFTIFYIISIFTINNVYYLYNLLKKGKTPKIPIYSLTALCAYLFSLRGMAFITIKNNSYLEMIKSANDYISMDKKQRFSSYMFYLSSWFVLGLFILLIYFQDTGYENAPGMCFLFIVLILLYRMISLYGFAGKRENDKNTLAEKKEPIKPIITGSSRQFLNFKINRSPEEVNIILNNYLIYNRFIQTYYNDEKVLKLNSFMAIQSFYDTYIKIYLTNTELTVIGWVTRKGIEYGFDDKLDLDDLAYCGNWKPIQPLYVLFRDITHGFIIDTKGDFVCEKKETKDIIVPQVENLFVPNIKFGKNKNYSKIIGVSIILILSIFSILSALLFQ